MIVKISDDLSTTRNTERRRYYISVLIYTKQDQGLVHITDCISQPELLQMSLDKEIRSARKKESECSLLVFPQRLPTTTGGRKFLGNHLWMAYGKTTRAREKKTRVLITYLLNIYLVRLIEGSVENLHSNGLRIVPGRRDLSLHYRYLRYLPNVYLVRFIKGIACNSQVKCKRKETRDFIPGIFYWHLPNVTVGRKDLKKKSF